MKFLFALLLSGLSFVLSAQMLTFDSLDLVKSEVIYFDFGRYEIRPEADSTLRAFAALTMGKENLTVHLTAHTDAIGSDEANQVLSQNRASAAKVKLVEYGLSDSLLIIQPFGESLPVAENETDAGRQQNRRVTIDLYKKTPMVYLSGQVKDQKTNEGIQAKVIIRQKEKKDSLTTNEDGHFRWPVPDQAVVGIDIYAPEYFFETQMFKVDAAKQNPLEIALPKAEAGASVDIKNLYFVGNQAILLKPSEPELPKLLKFMQINPGIKIEIAGHINRPFHDPVPEESWNFQLSVRRAKIVYDYLLSNGVSAERISYKGYGNSQMRYPKARSEREQALNRRVEIRILETALNSKFNR